MPHSFWSTMKLDEAENKGLVALGRGKVISRHDIADNPGNYPVYSSSAQGEGEFGRMSDYMFDEELITWSIDGGGRLFYRPKGRFSVTNVCGWLRSLSPNIDLRFLHASLDFQRSKIAFDYQSKAHPSVIRKLYDVILPPLPEQRRIAEILSSVDEAIRATEAVIEQTCVTRDSVLSLAFTGQDRPGSKTTAFDWRIGRLPVVKELPISWEIVRLIDVAKLESGHTPSKSQSKYWDGDIPWISLHDTPSLKGRKICETAQKTTLLGIANSSARMLPAGTVVFSRTATVGLSAIMGREMATSQDFANFICGPRINNRFLMHLLKYMAPVWSTLSSGSVHKTIYMPVFKSLQIALPPLHIQHEIADLADALFDAIEAAGRRTTALRSTKHALMSDLLTGRKRVTGAMALAAE